MKSTQLAMALLGRELRERYLSTFAGLAWVLITPVMLLAIYAFVFVELLGARFGNRVGGDVIAFLALGMWPWHAFADSLARGTSALTGNAALIGQIAIPRVWLVLVPTLGAALIHTASFVLVLLILLIMGRLQMGAGAWVAMVAYGLIVVNAAALSLLLAPLNVFFRDVGTLLPQILTFWMLLTPIFFDRALLRADLGEWLALNPMTGLVEALRAGLLHDQVDLTTLYSPLLFTLVLTLCSVIAARRFLARIEDFL
jgi:ABC-type polysaccharide/polyol phosphate export permease